MAAYSYTFSISGFHKIDAQTVGELFENMNAKGIDITPESVSTPLFTANSSGTIRWRQKSTGLNKRRS